MTAKERERRGSGLDSTDKVRGTWKSFWTTQRKEIVVGYLLLLPSFALLIFVIGWPLVRSVQLSFHELYLLKGFDSEHFVGLQQYIKLWHDPNLPQYLKNQAIWVAGATVLPILVGFVFALVLNRRVLFRGIWRALILVPWAMPVAAAALGWQWMLDGQWGIVNYYLKQLGLIDEYVRFLVNPNWVWPSVLLISTWRYFPFNYVALLAGLQGISEELYDAGRVDGTNTWTAFRYITFPLLWPILGVLLILGAIWSMNDFTGIWMVTEGGPGTATTTLAPLVYRISFDYYRLGYGATVGMYLMMMSMVLTIYYVRRVRYEEGGT